MRRIISLSMMVGVALFTAEKSAAYIDPGTGMAVATGIGAWIVGIIAFLGGILSLTYKKWVSGMKKIFSFVFRRGKSKINNGSAG